MNEQTPSSAEPNQPVAAAQPDTTPRTDPSPVGTAIVSLPSAGGQPAIPVPKRTANTLKNILSTLLILLVAPAIAVFLTLYVFQSYQVDGPSMQNTLHNNDRLIVWKLPRTWSRVTGHQYVPKRGDIIVFTETGLSNYGDTANTKQLIKRVIGLPGDHVVVKNGAITIYNKQHPDGFQPDKTLPYGKNGAIPVTADNVDVTLRSTQLFVCGDNRGDSLDSRIFGPIETKDVIGKLVLRVLPLSDAERF